MNDRIQPNGASVAVTVGSRSESALQKREADSMVLAGVGIGLIGVVSAALGGVVCPVCVIAAPALVGVGAIRRWRSQRRQVDGASKTSE